MVLYFTCFSCQMVVNLLSTFNGGPPCLTTKRHVMRIDQSQRSLAIGHMITRTTSTPHYLHPAPPPCRYTSTLPCTDTPPPRYTFTAPHYTWTTTPGPDRISNHAWKYLVINKHYTTGLVNFIHKTTSYNIAVTNIFIQILLSKSILNIILCYGKPVLFQLHTCIKIFLFLCLVTK